MHDQNRAPDLIRIGIDRLIHKGFASYDIPAAIGVKGSYMIAAIGLIIAVIVLYKERCVIRKRIHHTAAEGIFSGRIVF